MAFKDTAIKKVLIVCVALIPILFLMLSLMANEACALSIDFTGDEPSQTSKIIQMILLLSVLSLAPSLLIMVTSFTRVTVVLSFLRHAMGLQQSPPNMVITSLALFMTFFIMSPVVERAYEEGLKPYGNSQINEKEAWRKTTAPFRDFMLKHVQDKDLDLFLSLTKDKPAENKKEVSLAALTPAFMLSELRRSFEIGFLLFIPFIVIDFVVAALLMSMGMMMVPPTAVALPFKVIFFVLVDGWHLLVGSLLKSFLGTG